MEKKETYGYIGHIDHSQHLAHLLAEEIRKQEPVILVTADNIEDASIEAINKAALEMEPIVLHNPYKDFIPWMPQEKVKPTCERNHEYIQKNEWEGTRIIRSHWECRFCGRKL
jgi:hypothetical protein